VRSPGETGKQLHLRATGGVGRVVCGRRTNRQPKRETGCHRLRRFTSTAKRLALGWSMTTGKRLLAALLPLAMLLAFSAIQWVIVA
jgi:hypothetical protein